MGASEELHRELGEIEEILRDLPEQSTVRRHLESRRAEIVTRLEDDKAADDPPGSRDTDGEDLAGAAAPPSGEPTGSRRPTTAYLAAALAAIAVLAGGAVWWNSNYGSVPDVVNAERGFASGVLRSEGYEVEVITEPDPNVADGQVLSQEPAPGSRLRTGESVTLTVAEPPTYDVMGAFVLLADTDGPDSDCRGSGGYSDIRSGVTVTARDGTGRTLATGRLGPGTRESIISCVFEFEVRGLAQSDFYSFEVGRRGELTYSHAEMEAARWTVGFELGR